MPYFWSLSCTIQFFLIIFKFFIKDFHGSFSQQVPIVLFVSFKVCSDFLNVVHDLLDSSIWVDVQVEWISICPQNMLSLLLFWWVIKEIPAFWWSQLIEIFSLLNLLSFCLLVFCSFIVFLYQFLLVLNPLSLIKVNLAFDLLFLMFDFLETFEKNVIFYVLEYVHINVLKPLSSFQPFRLFVWVEIAFPNPVPAIDFSFLLLERLLLLLFSHEVFVRFLLFFL